jgi:hypothetical protein
VNHDWRESFHQFALAVAERLEKGERQYRGRTFELPASSIIAEAQAELLDNAAYSFVAWCRLERLRQELNRAEEALQPVTDQEQDDQHAKPDAVNRRPSQEPLRARRQKLGDMRHAAEDPPRSADATPAARSKDA